MELKDYTTEQLQSELKRRVELTRDPRYEENAEVKEVEDNSLVF